MKHIVTFVVLVIATFFILWPQLVMAGSRGGVDTEMFILSPKQDNFYAQYGGRVFRVVCGRRQVYVWKYADNERGFYNCRSTRTSRNAYQVERRGRRWIRAK